MSFVHTSMMCMAKVIVNLDLRDGLTEDIMIEWGGSFSL